SAERMTVMTAVMAHVSGSIMAAYIAMGIEARHLLTAVIMTAPGTILMAKIIEPETEPPQTLGGVRVEIPRTDVNIVDAAARGTPDGLHLMLNVIAMPVSFVPLVALQIGGIGALVPDRKHDLARLGFRAMIAGTLANFLSATLAGMLL